MKLDDSDNTSEQAKSPSTPTSTDTKIEEILERFMYSFTHLDDPMDLRQTATALNSIITQRELQSRTSTIDRLRSAELPYPETVFGEVPKGDWSKIDEFAKTLGYRIDTISGDLMRRGWNVRQRQLNDAIQDLEAQLGQNNDI